MTLVTSDLAGRLRSALLCRAAATLADEGAQRAAVAVVVTDEPQPALLLVKREERVGDPWSGHVAFPGGFESEGETAAQTAEREAEEETGLPLARIGERLGPLDDVYPRSVYLPKVVVTPFVFAVHGRPTVVAGPEVDRAVWVPAEEVFDAANRRPFRLTLPVGPRQFESIVVRDLTIWGLTERILAQIPSLLA